jgi:transketolase
MLNIDSNILAKEIRLASIKITSMANSSHIGSCLSIADILAVLYSQFIDFNDYENRTRFILSKGHACAALYSSLMGVGIISKDDLETFGKDFSKLSTHASSAVPGVEFSTGSLGHGLPFAVGKALYAKRLKKKWKTIVLLSDGEMDEGSNWEAILFAAHHNLNNLCFIIDYNNLQSMDSVENTLSLEPIVDKLISFGADVFDIDGHHHQSIVSSISVKTSKVKAIVARTTKGKGVSFMENQVEWHYKSLSPEEYKVAYDEIVLN